MADEKTPAGTPEARPQSEGTSNTIIHPVSGFDNSSTIGNSVFGAGIFGNMDSGQNDGYDDGNVIPLSERFNKDEKDIRYSTRSSFDEMAGEAKAEHGVSEGI